ncbi:hypothetical protein GCM10022281_02830 [Sphingomonas rosea]|jgi:hypothetical protein|uniref:DUF3147 family protein n=2 Tax=Sphingomonas rosea TaxID=335605 RepID=A0ABP7TKB0_9SPHN
MSVGVLAEAGTLSSLTGFGPYLGHPSGWPFFLCVAETKGPPMLGFLAKAGIAGLLAAAVAEIARRSPGWGGLLASLPLTSLMACTLLYWDTGDTAKVADLSNGIMWFIVPSLPLFLVLPVLLRSGMNFWLALGLVIAGTMALYAATFALAGRMGVKL